MLNARRQTDAIHSCPLSVSPGIAQQKIKQGVGRPAEFLPPRQRFEGVFSWLRLLHRKIYLFFCAALPSKSKGCAAGDFFGAAGENFWAWALGSQKIPFCLALQ